MKLTHTFIITTIFVCFVLLGVIYNIVLSGTSADWKSISGIVAGIYLYFVYLIFSILLDKPKTTDITLRNR